MQELSEPRERPATAGLRERKKHFTRQELLSAGRRLFAEQGLYAARIEDVSLKAGVAKGTLYGYFRSKEELALEVVSLGFRDLQREVRAGLERAAHPSERIELMLEAHLGFFTRNPDLLRVFHQVRGALRATPPGWRPLRRELSQHIQFLADQLQPRDLPGDRMLALHQARTLFGALSGILSVHVSLDPQSRRPWMSQQLLRGVAHLIRTLDPDAANPAAPSPRAPSM